MDLCGRKIPPRTSPCKDFVSEPSQELENSEKDASPDPDALNMLPDAATNNSTDNVGDVLPAPNLQLENTEPEQNDNISATTLTDDSEEGASMFLKYLNLWLKVSLRKSMIPAAVMIWML